MNVGQNLLLAFIRNVQHLGLRSIVIWGQILVAIFSLGVGYIVGHYVTCWLKNTRYGNQQKTLHARELVRLVFPLTAFVVISLLNAIWHVWYSPLYLLDLTGALLLALVLLRVIVRMLDMTFPTQKWVRQSERGAIWIVWVLFALYVTGFSGPIIVVLKAISFEYGKSRTSLWDVMQTITVVATMLLISLVLSNMIEIRLLRITTGDVSLRVVIARLIKATFVILAFLIALPLVGIDLTVLSVFGGALGVGLGFGLQKIASNYISGFILLLDRSLRIGDMIQVGTEQGQVEGLTARYIILKAMDGTVSLIPNDNVISSIVVNKSYIDQNLRAAISVQISYTSDIKLAMQLMLEATKGLSRILSNPAPSVTFEKLGKEGVELELSFWIADQENGTGSLRSAINMQIWESFHQNGIRFSYPQRDIHIVSLPPELDHLLKDK